EPLHIEVADVGDAHPGQLAERPQQVPPPVTHAHDGDVHPTPPHHTTPLTRNTPSSSALTKRSTFRPITRPTAAASTAPRAVASATPRVAGRRSAAASDASPTPARAAPAPRTVRASARLRARRRTRSGRARRSRQTT